MPIKTSSAKAKGRKLQNTIRDTILTSFPALSPEDVRSCPMGSNGQDIWLSEAARAAFPYSVEAKARKGVSLIYDAMEQADKAANGLNPVAIVKADRKAPLVVMTMDHFFALVTGEASGF